MSTVLDPQNLADTQNFDENFGPVRRRVRRLARRMRWWTKGILGLQRTILVEMRWRLGDEIMALPVYDLLRTRHPKVRLEILTNHPDLFIGNSSIDAVNPQRRDPDKYLLLRGAPRDRYRIAHYASRAHVSGPKERPRIDCSSWSSLLVAELPTQNFVAVAAGASWPTKRMPPAAWRGLCTSLLERGLSVVELGQVGEEVGIGKSLVGRTTVKDAAVVLRRASVLVCSDSGLMHLGLAVGTPVVALFGPTDPAVLVQDEPLLHALTNNRKCQGCWNNMPSKLEPGVCPLGIETCMDTISLEDVLSRVDSVLGSKAA